MDPQVSLYCKERKLIQLLQKYGVQQQYIANKKHIEKLNIIKECLELFNDLTETRVDFQTRAISTCSHIKLCSQAGQNFCKLKTYVFDFSKEAENNMEIECCEGGEKINDLVASTLKYKDHFDQLKSLKKFSDVVVGH